MITQQRHLLTRGPPPVGYPPQLLMTFSDSVQIEGPRTFIPRNGEVQCLGNRASTENDCAFLYQIKPLREKDDFLKPLCVIRLSPYIM
jgi:hypothetical protein